MGFLTSFSERERRSQRLFDYFERGEVETAEAIVFPLSEGKEAHQYLESGKILARFY